MSYGMDGWCKEPNNAGDGSNCTNNAQNSEDKTTGDLISRAAAIDELDKGAWGVEWDKTLAKTMIESLPSAQPTDADIQRMQDIEQAMLDKAFECRKQDAARWIPCSERLPFDAGYYLTTTTYNEVFCDYWNLNEWNRTEQVIAWMPLPEPYREVSE